RTQAPRRAAPQATGKTASGASGNLRFGQSRVFRKQLFMRLGVSGIEFDALDRTHLDALRFGVVADALRAQVGRYFVDVRTHGDRPVRTHRLADIAIDALVGDAERQITSSRRSGNRPPTAQALRRPAAGPRARRRTTRPRP